VIELSFEELASLSLGKLWTRAGLDAIDGVEIDSRRVQAGDLFVTAGKGGADYLDAARVQGAAATLEPDDAHVALATLASVVRSRISATVVAITGSVGKTTTKDITAALCRQHRKLVAAEASYNNEVGLPLTLCRADEETQLIILEMGMRGLGQVDELCRIARPDIGVITSIGPAHLELLGSMEDVAKGKAEILSHLPDRGVAIVPENEERLEQYLPSSRAQTLTFGPGGDIELVELETSTHRSIAQVKVEGISVELEFNFTGRHNVENALAAVGIYHALGLPLDGIGMGADTVELSPMRGEEVQLRSGGLLLNDSYNANPLSMKAAIRHLAERAGARRRVAVIGGMAELGEESALYHREIGVMLGHHGVDVVIAVGEHAEDYSEGLASAGGTSMVDLVETTDDAIGLLRMRFEPGDCVLVKASRANGLEKVADALQTFAV
jgi:UDP-N-acetylmuramoyl-tripeptide--D-alanyl-D-alanine ligase